MQKYLQLREVHACLIFGDIEVATEKLERIAIAGTGSQPDPAWLQHWAMSVRAICLSATGAYRQAVELALEAARRTAACRPPAGYPHGLERQQLELLALQALLDHGAEDAVARAAEVAAGLSGDAGQEAQLMLIEARLRRFQFDAIGALESLIANAPPGLARRARFLHAAALLAINARTEAEVPLQALGLEQGGAGRDARILALQKEAIGGMLLGRRHSAALFDLEIGQKAEAPPQQRPARAFRRTSCRLQADIALWMEELRSIEPGDDVSLKLARRARRTLAAAPGDADSPLLQALRDMYDGALHFWTLQALQLPDEPGHDAALSRAAGMFRRLGMLAQQHRCELWSEHMAQRNTQAGTQLAAASRKWQSDATADSMAARLPSSQVTGFKLAKASQLDRVLDAVLQPFCAGFGAQPPLPRRPWHWLARRRLRHAAARVLLDAMFPAGSAAGEPAGTMRQLWPASVRDLARRWGELPERHAVVIYRASANYLYTLLITRDGIRHATQQQIDRVAAWNAARMLANLFSKCRSPLGIGQPLANSHREAWTALSHLLLPAALQRHLAGLTHLHVMDDGILGPLPVSMLLSSGVPLFHFLAVSRLYSWHAPGRAARRPPLAQLQVGFVGIDSQQPADGAAQPGQAAFGAADLAACKAGLNVSASTHLSGPAATHEGLRRLAGSMDIVHVHAHGHCNSAQPERSYIELHDGPIHADEIAGWARQAGWLMRAELVYLSSCWAADAPSLPNEARGGCALAFSKAGAAQAVGCIWEIEQLENPLFCQHFYAEYGITRDSSTAVAHAQRMLFDAGSPGRHYAGYCSFLHSF